MPTIYRKTVKGLAEVETRAHRLTPRIRSMLILVDGKRDADDLRALVTQQADECLQTLSEDGFIEAVGETVRNGSVPAGPASPVVVPTPVVQIDEMRRAAVRALNDALGPGAESLAVRMERAQTLQELQLLFAQAAKLLAAARGQAAASAFAARFPFE
jgi:hypothetical protein